MTIHDPAERAAGDPPDRPATGDLLDRLQHSALTVLSGLDRPPRSLRLTADGVEIELQWPDPAAAAAAVPAPTAGIAPVAAVPTATDAGHFITAETVGVFYRGPEPGADPYVVPGDEVAGGQQVGIVEAMKLMMPVEAPAASRILAVLVENGASVEFGEKLFSYEPIAS